MKEIGIEISDQHSKSIEEFKDMKFDIVVIVCDNAKETCPYFLGKKIHHKGFDDPATTVGTIKDILKVFRKIRDQFKELIKVTFETE